MSGADKEQAGGASPPAEDWLPLLDEEDNGPEVSPLIVDAVGRALQSHFQAIADMPLPDRFLVLLAELEARERSA
jgi:Anti-sigma factor NepR